MSTDPAEQSRITDVTAPSHRLLGPRKRIVAREVQSAALSTLRPGDLPDLRNSVETAPVLRVRPSVVVLDPTVQLGERHRKHSHEWGYRLTAITAVLTFITASGAIALLLMDRLTAARLAAVAAIVLAVASLQLARTSKLAGRLRGYAVAATVLASISLGVNLAGNFVHDLLNDSKSTVAKPH